MGRFLIVCFACTVLFGCGPTAEEKAATANEDARKAAAEFIDSAMPGAKKLASRIQQQIDWRKKHNVTKEDVDAMWQKWIQQNPGKDIDDFWNHAVTVTPAELQ